MDLAELGLTREELQQRVVDTICNKLLAVGSSDTVFAEELETLVKEQITSSVCAVAEKHLVPGISERIENICLQATTAWGEKKGEPLSFTQYLLERADAYLLEPVDYGGKTKAEARGLSWNKDQTRITYMIHRHLHCFIEAAMKEVLKKANTTIVEGIEKTVKIKLKEVANALKITVTTG